MTDESRSPPPQQPPQLQFKGWTPTVSGRLSLSILGQTPDPTPAIVANISDGYSRYVACYQKRVLLDTGIPFKELLSPFLFGLSGRFWFVCIANASDKPSVAQEELRGHLYIFHTKPVWRNKAEPIVRGLQKTLRDFEEVLPDTSLDSYINEEYRSALATLEQLASYSAAFVLHRDGDTTITTEEFGSPIPGAPSFPQDQTSNRYMRHVVASQMFFFLRDICHIHQHHDPRTDTLVDLYPFDGKDDFSWRCETLRGLYRKILEFKRARKDEAYGASLGILAYAKSFEECSNDRGPTDADGNTRKIEPRVRQHLIEESIRANQDTLRNNAQRSITNADRFRNWMISILTIMISFVGLLQLSGSKAELADPDPLLVWVGNMLVQYPAFIFVMVTFVIFLGAHRVGMIDVGRWPFSRMITRQVQAKAQNKAARLMYLIGFGFLALAIWLILRIHNVAVLTPILDGIANLFS